LTELNKIVKPRPKNDWNRQIDEWTAGGLFTYKKSDTEIKPQAVIETLYTITGGDAIVCTEVGQHQMWTAHYYKFKTPRSLLTSGGLGTMGFGFPAAMGAALGKPGKPVIDIAGDGSIQMNIQELATVSLNNIPVKIVILNNGWLGMVRQWQDLFHGRRRSATCLRRNHQLCESCEPGKAGCRLERSSYIPDFVALAQAYGVAGFRAEKVGDVERVLREGLAVDGPAVMEFVVAEEENVFPMVPAGKPLGEIMLEG
jgi:acetolactate synthase-1/2/3 large subunit